MYYIYANNITVQEILKQILPYNVYIHILSIFNVFNIYANNAGNVYAKH